MVTVRLSDVLKWCDVSFHLRCVVHKGDLPVGDPRLSYSSKVGSPDACCWRKREPVRPFLFFFLVMLSASLARVRDTVQRDTTAWLA